MVHPHILHRSPYDLRDASAQGPFLPRLRSFADEFLREAEDRLGEVLDGHTAFLAAGNDEPMRSRGEYAIELLTFGLLRREYGALSAATTDSVIERLEEMWRIRSTEPSRKPQADSERARLFHSLLSEGTGSQTSNAVDDDPRLVRWLAAIGEFEQEALRMDTWLQSTGAFWSPSEFVAFTDGFAEWFALSARDALGPWTRGVDDFRRTVLREDLPREDLFLVTRSEALYHLNMVGAEVMNRGFLPGYAKRPSKVVLVPGCMRSRPEGECRARRDGLDISCTRCHASCEVAALDRLAEKHGFRVFVVPHASSFTAWLRHWRTNDTTALVAAACPLHLVPGGYEMRALGLEAQCVLLDYSGCKRHWDPRGTPTKFDHDRLLELLGNGHPETMPS